MKSEDVKNDFFGRVERDAYENSLELALLRHNFRVNGLLLKDFVFISESVDYDYMNGKQQFFFKILCFIL